MYSVHSQHLNLQASCLETLYERYAKFLFWHPNSVKNCTALPSLYPVAQAIVTLETVRQNQVCVFCRRPNLSYCEYESKYDRCSCLCTTIGRIDYFQCFYCLIYRDRWRATGFYCCGKQTVIVVIPALLGGYFFETI